MLDFPKLNRLRQQTLFRISNPLPVGGGPDAFAPQRDPVFWLGEENVDAGGMAGREKRLRRTTAPRLEMA